MRSKEESSDYRYFPEPDLVPLAVDDEWRSAVRGQLPELPQARRSRLVAAGLDESSASQLAADAALSGLYDEAMANGADSRSVANWLTGEVIAFRRRTDTTLEETLLTAHHLVELSAMVGGGELSATAAKEVLGFVLSGEGEPRAIAEAHDLIQVTDTGALEVAVDEVLAANTDAVDKIKDGDTKPVGFLVGQVMKATGGKADPRMVTEIINRRAKG
jgi:aspartyl-tRNA(Asn)/glutamyl-tRNA(Gln) amidotransferase subunit B